jgi:hypothetical protein
MSDSTQVTAPPATPNNGAPATPDATAATTPPAGTTPPADPAATQQPGATTPPADGKPAGEGNKGADTKPPAGAPEKYEFKAPEGQSFDAGVLSTFEAAAREANLPQEAAQGLLDKLAPALAEKQQRLVQEARTQWVADAKADKELGGTNFDANLAGANKVLQQFGTPELKDLLDRSGLGDHPELLRWAFRVSKAISEDTFVSGNGGKPGGGDARSIYGKSNMNP